MRFKEFLVESADSPFITDLDVINRIMRAVKTAHNNIFGFKIHDNGSVDIQGKKFITISDNLDSQIIAETGYSLYSESNFGKHLAIKFGSVKGSFNCRSSSITSLYGFPDRAVEGIVMDTKITTYEHITPIQEAGFMLRDNRNAKSLVGISKFIQEINNNNAKTDNIIIDSTIIEGGLGFLKVRGNFTVEPDAYDGNKNLIKAIEIINEHLMGDRDLIACKRELISNGLQEFAKL